MLINSFRNILFINVFYLAVIVFSLRYLAIFSVSDTYFLDAYPTYTTFLKTYGITWLLNPTFTVFITSLIIFIQSLLFNQIISKYNLFNKTTFLPALMFVLLCSYSPTFLAFTPLLFCNFLILWLLDKILSMYKSINTMRTTFDMGLIIALGTMLYFPFWPTIFIAWVSLSLFKSFAWREWICVLFGFIAPFIILGTYYYVNHSMEMFFQIWLPFKFKSEIKLNFSAQQYFTLIPIALVLLVSLNTAREKYFKHVIQVRKSQQILVFLLILFMFSYLLIPNIGIGHLLLLAAPLSVFLTLFFVTSKKRWFYEFMFVLLLASVLYFQTL